MTGNNQNKEKREEKGNGEDEELKDRITPEEEMTSEKIGEDKEKEKAGERPDYESKKASEEEERKKEEELIRELQEEIDKLTTRDIVIQMMMSLSSLAYKKMGLPMGVNDKYKDKEQARLAIDCFSALLRVVSEEVSEAERENLEASLSNLQINFVKVFT
ncbi:MAG: DUF1844 domain-containing protein [Actinobacteria bacterium]|nr:DUF1844 domain-containing protein [Actinomycetota bacterium]